MDRQEAWKKLKEYRIVIRKMEEHKRGKILKRLEKQVRDKQKEFDEKKKEYANEEKKRNQIHEKLEEILREKRKELEKETIERFGNT